MLEVFKWVLCAIHTNTCIFVDLDFYRIFIWDVFMPYFLWVLPLFCCFDAQGAFVWQIFDKDIRHMFKSKCYLFDLLAKFLSLYSWPSNIHSYNPRQKANHSRTQWVFCKNVYHLYCICIYAHSVPQTHKHLIHISAMFTYLDNTLNEFWCNHHIPFSRF